MDEITNARRADWALSALEGFALTTGVDTPRDAICDLICNLLHLARFQGLDLEHVTQNALQIVREEYDEDPEGDREMVRSRLNALFS